MKESSVIFKKHHFQKAVSSKSKEERVQRIHPIAWKFTHTTFVSRVTIGSSLPSSVWLWTQMLKWYFPTTATQISEAERRNDQRSLLWLLSESFLIFGTSATRKSVEIVYPTGRISPKCSASKAFGISLFLEGQDFLYIWYIWIYNIQHTFQAPKGVQKFKNHCLFHVQWKQIFHARKKSCQNHFMGPLSLNLQGKSWGYPILVSNFGTLRGN